MGQHPPPDNHLLAPLHQLAHRLHRGSRAARLRQQHLAGLVDGEDAAQGRLGRLLEADGRQQRCSRVAQERVRQLLLVLEGGVGLGRVSAQAVDGQAAGRQGLVRVPKQACLGGACLFARTCVSFPTNLKAEDRQRKGREGKGECIDLQPGVEALG